MKVKRIGPTLVIALALAACSGAPSPSPSPAAAEAGRVESVSYQLSSGGQDYLKSALVYLPPGYDQGRQDYPVLYLIHGSGGDGSEFLGRPGEAAPRVKQLLDSLMGSGAVVPMIVVAPTYYPDPSFRSPDYFDDAPLVAAFAAAELTEEVIPAVESRYATRGEVTREHRALAGFSMGAVATWSALETQLDEFSEFLPVAGDSWTIVPNGGASQPEATAAALAEAVADQGYESGFHIRAAVGELDGTKKAMDPMIAAMQEHPGGFDSSHLDYRVYTGLGGHEEGVVVAHLSEELPKLFTTTN